MENEYKIFYIGFDGRVYDAAHLTDDFTLDSFPSPERARDYMYYWLYRHPEYKKLTFVFLPFFKSK